MKKWAIVFCVLLLTPALTTAQNFKLEVLKPQFKFGKNAEPSTFTTAWFVTAALPVWGRVHVVGQLPFAFGKLEGGSVPTEDETLGNPGLGLRFQHERLTIEAMVRAPLVKNGFAGFIGSIADFDRQEAFIPDLLPISGTIRTKIDVSRFNIQPYGGVSLNFKLKHERNDFFQDIFSGLRENDGELHVMYGAEGWLELHPLYVGAALNGRTWVSSGGNFDESAIHQVNLRAKLDFKKFVPGAMFRFPLDDLLLDSVMGLNLEVLL